MYTRQRSPVAEPTRTPAARRDCATFVDNDIFDTMPSASADSFSLCPLRFVCGCVCMVDLIVAWHAWFSCERCAALGRPTHFTCYCTLRAKSR